MGLVSKVLVSEKWSCCLRWAASIEKRWEQVMALWPSFRNTTVIDEIYLAWNQESTAGIELY